MNIQRLLWVTAILAVALSALAPSRCWAVYFPLGPSSDDWGLKYEVDVSESSDDELNIVFTLADQGRLQPIYSVTLVAFSKKLADGGRTYLVKAPIDLNRTKDGKYSGQVKIPSKHAKIASLRILTLNVDGRRQTAGAAYYDIPLKKFVDLTKASNTGAPPNDEENSKANGLRTP